MYIFKRGYLVWNVNLNLFKSIKWYYLYEKQYLIYQFKNKGYSFIEIGAEGCFPLTF